MRVVRQPHRAQAQHARRRRGHGQLRDRAGERRASTPARRARRARRRGRGRRLHGAPAAAGRGAPPRRRPDAARCAPARSSRPCSRCRCSRSRWSRRCSSTTGSGSRSSSRRRSCCGRAGRSTAPPGRTSATARRRWTRSISVGTLAAWGWSVDLAVLPRRGPARDAHAVRADHVARRPRATRSISRSPPSSRRFILTGRYFEARAKRRSGAALRALLELGAKDVAVLGDDGRERRVADRRAAGRRPLRRPARREGRDRRRRRGGLVGRRPGAPDRRVDPGREAPRRRGRRARPSTPAVASSCAPRGSGPTPRWPRSAGS